MDNGTFCLNDTLYLENVTTVCGNFSGSTNAAQEEAATALPPGVAYFAIIAGGLFNVGLLAIFIKRRSLRNSFGVYLINLLLIDSVLVFIHGPFNLIDRYGSSWYVGLGACIFWGHVSFTYQNLVIVAHFLIALNRVWAVLLPFSYRTHHTTKVAILMCAMPWLFLNIVNIPVALVTSYITPGVNNGTFKCNSDSLQLGIWGSITQLAFFDTPIVFVVLAYPVVCYKSFFSARINQRVAPNTTNSRTQRASMAASVSNRNPSGEQQTGASHGTTESRKAHICGRTLSGSLTGFVTLTLMTTSVIVCLMPNEIYYTILIFTDTDFPRFFAVADILERLTIVTDPVLVVLGNTELRTMVLAWIRRLYI